MKLLIQSRIGYTLKINMHDTNLSLSALQRKQEWVITLIVMAVVCDPRCKQCAAGPPPAVICIKASLQRLQQGGQGHQRHQHLLGYAQWSGPQASSQGKADRPGDIQCRHLHYGEHRPSACNRNLALRVGVLGKIIQGLGGTALYTIAQVYLLYGIITSYTQGGVHIGYMDWTKLSSLHQGVATLLFLLGVEFAWAFASKLCVDKQGCGNCTVNSWQCMRQRSGACVRGGGGEGGLWDGASVFRKQPELYTPLLGWQLSSISLLSPMSSKGVIDLPELTSD